MTPTQFAAFLRRAFTTDVWYGLPASERALRRAGCPLSAESVWGAAQRAGWADYYDGNQEWLLDSQKLPTA